MWLVGSSTSRTPSLPGATVLSWVVWSYRLCCGLTMGLVPLSTDKPVDSSGQWSQLGMPNSG